jgi:hypothetical protein
MKPRTQEELEMFFLPTDGTSWDQDTLIEYRQWCEDAAAQLEYQSWLDTIDALHKETK